MYEHNFWFGDHVMRVVVTASDPNVSLEAWLLFAIMILGALGMGRVALDGGIVVASTFSIGAADLTLIVPHTHSPV